MSCGWGVVHGCAGSAAVVILASGHVQDLWWQLLYVSFFALGACLGMVVFSAVVLIPLCMRQQSMARGLSIGAGCISVGIGIYLGIKIAVVDGLLFALA